MIEEYERHWQEPVGLKDRAIAFGIGLAGYALSLLRSLSQRRSSLSRGGRRNG